jgi:riboflavin kinase/FMN adenylyltransferase
MIDPTNNFEIFGDSEIIHQKKPICITFGNFDGVHLGHQHLIQSMIDLNKNIAIVVVTFEPHTSHFFAPQISKPLITCQKDKINFLLQAGASAVVVQKFDKNFAEFSADDFCKQWLSHNFNVHSVFLGYDFFYGKGRKGNFSHMKEYGKQFGWNVQNISALENNSQNPISSSLIRTEISEGNIAEAESYLGHHYFLSGVVTTGDKRGRTIGFPTANLKPECDYILPKFGVYSCYVTIEDENAAYKMPLPAVMNCGIRPSIGEGLKIQIEAHILNFNDFIYDKKVKFFPRERIRGEMKFSNLEELKKQIQLDITKAEKFFHSSNGMRI